MRLRVLDHHVMVGQLVAPGQVKPVQDALDPFAGQGRANIIPRQARPRGNRVRNEVAAPPQMGVDGRDVISVPALVLEFHVLHHRAFPQNQFGHRVREIRRLGEADIAFEHRHLAGLFGDDQVARVRRGPGLLRRRDEQQMHRRLQPLARGNINKPAVLEESRVERRKRVVFALRVARQMFLNQSGVAGQRRGQAADDDALRLRPGADESSGT